jgi:hypothetical protein
VRLVFALVVLGVTLAILWWRYRDEFNWSPLRPPSSEGYEEAGSEE